MGAPRDLPSRPPQFGGTLPSRGQPPQARDMTPPQTTKTVAHAALIASWTDAPKEEG